jgi:hypothetical protein
MSLHEVGMRMQLRCDANNRIASVLPAILQVTNRFWRCEYSCGISPTSALTQHLPVYWLGSAVGALLVRVVSTTLEHGRWAYNDRLLR